MSHPAFHPGEMAVQKRAGESHVAARTGRSLLHGIPDAGREFIAGQRMAILASSGRQGRPWASMIPGSRGFASAPEPSRLVIDLSRAAFHPEDPLWEALASDPRAGALFIELATRRRLRVNGRARLVSGNALEIAVEEAYPNCPKYIQRREEVETDIRESHPPEPARKGGALEDAHLSWIREADTVFVASLNPEGNADASHRGGRHGFVRISAPSILRIPDYPGNGMFNTLGNIQVHPMAGLLFVDFDGRRLLQLTGKARILWDVEGSGRVTGGTSRWWELRVEEWIETRLPPVLGWRYVDSSPHNPPAGDP